MKKRFKKAAAVLLSLTVALTASAASLSTAYAAQASSGVSAGVTVLNVTSSEIAEIGAARAIQAALYIAGENATDANPYKIVVEPGEYQLDGALNVSGNTTLSLNGVTLKRGGTANMLRVGADSNHRYRRLLDEAERYYPEIHDRFFRLHTEALHTMLQHGMEYMQQHNYLRHDADIDVAIDFLCDLIQQHRLSDVDDQQAYLLRLNEICFTYLRGLMSTDSIKRYEESEPHFRQVMKELGMNDEL